MPNYHFAFQDAVYFLLCLVEQDRSVFGVKMVGLHSTDPGTVVSDTPFRNNMLVVDNVAVVIHNGNSVYESIKECSYLASASWRPSVSTISQSIATMGVSPRKLWMDGVNTASGLNVLAISTVR